MDKTYQMILLYIVLPLVGIGLIVFALVRGRRLCQRPVEIAFTKLGLNLKSDAVTFMILLGFVMSSAGIFFWYRGYETKIAVIEKDREQKENEIKNLHGQLERFKVYTMRFHLIFPPTDAVNTHEVKVSGYIWKQGKGNPLIPELQHVPGVNELWVDIDNLNPGDLLQIVVREGAQKSWQSDRIEIPKTDLLMRRV